MKKILKKLPLWLTFVASVISGCLSLTPVIPEDYKTGIGIMCLIFGIFSFGAIVISFIINTAQGE